MSPNEFNNIFSYILKNHHFCRLTSNSAEYHGKYKNKIVKIKMTDLGMNRYIYMNGCKYYTTYIGCEYAIGVRMI